MITIVIAHAYDDEKNSRTTEVSELRGKRLESLAELEQIKKDYKKSTGHVLNVMFDENPEPEMLNR